jgi:hypothetical protein
MNAENMEIDWRDANTIPRFNAAGVKKQTLIATRQPTHFGLGNLVKPQRVVGLAGQLSNPGLIETTG